MISIRVNSGPTQQLIGRWIRLGRDTTRLVRASTVGVRKSLLEHFKAKQAEPDKRGWGKSNFWMDVYRSTQITKISAKAGEITIGDARYSPRFTSKTIRAGKSISSKSGKPTMFLAIPAASESAHIRPLQFEQTKGIKLFFQPIDSETGLLQGFTTEKDTRSLRLAKEKRKELIKARKQLSKMKKGSAQHIKDQISDEIARINADIKAIPKAFDKREGSRIFYVLKKSIVQPADPSWFPKQSELEEGARVELDDLFRRELK